MAGTPPSEVDAHLGRRIRERRNVLGMSQETLADALGIVTQQISKYEVSANRVAASRLWDIGKALEVDVGYFFEGIQKRPGRTRKLLESKTGRRKGRSARR